VETSDILGVLPIKELEAGVNAMTHATGDSSWMAALYLNNLLNRLNTGNKGGELAKELQRIIAACDATQKQILQCRWDKDSFNGEKAQILDNEKRRKAAVQDGEDLKTYYEGELCEVKAKLSRAEADEKSYTWRMFGNSVSIWQADVALAKEKIGRYNREIAEMEKKIEGCGKDVQGARMEEEKAGICRALANNKASIDQQEALIQTLTEREGKLQQAKIAKTNKLASLLQDTDCDSVNELLDAMDAMKTVGQAGVAHNQTGAVVLSGWLKDLNFLSSCLSKMIKDDITLDKQKKIVACLKKWTHKEEQVFCEFLRHMRPLTSIPAAALQSQRSNLDCSAIDFDTEKQVDVVAELSGFEVMPELQDVPTEEIDALCERLLAAPDVEAVVGPVVIDIPPATSDGLSLEVD